MIIMFCKFSFSSILSVKRKEDRISELPDEILQHILSFIDTAEAVRASILSKRWKHLRPSLVNIRLHLHGAVSRHRVPRFVSQFLSHRDATAPLHDFHLSLDSERWVSEDLALVGKCVLYAINHGVQSLRLNVPRGLNLRLPDSLSTCTTLRELEIRQINTWIYLKPFSLPNLTTLYLDVHLPFNFSGLPGLEKLSMALWDGLVLRAPKLRVLEILESDSIFPIKEISAPLLTSFRYMGVLPLQCCKINLPMLEEVYLNIQGIMFKKFERFHLMCVTLLQQLGNATIVSLTLKTLMALEKDGGPIEQRHPPFPNLKCLKLIKGSNEICTVLQSVVNYLTIGTLYFESSLKVEIPRGVAVVQKHPKAYDHLFFYEDYTQ